MMNYDPNLVFCGRMAKQTVRLTFGQWEYRKTMEVTVGGNCRGLTVIEAAVENAFDQLPEIPIGGKTIILTGANGEELECSLHEDDCSEDDWLKNMLLSAEIIDIQPDEKSKGKKK